jgi:hypothetical protein
VLVEKSISGSSVYPVHTSAGIDIGLILVVKSGQHDCAGGPMFKMMEEKVFPQKETMALKSKATYSVLNSGSITC